MTGESVSLETAKKIMGNNVIGPNELKKINEFGLDIPCEVSEIPYGESTLWDKRDNYYLIYGVSKFNNGNLVNIRNIKRIFGDDPMKNSPCFYFQDWYDNETFIDVPMEEGWFFIRKNVFEDSRAVQPDELKKRYLFPKAITCTYAFFIVWLVLNEKLWYHDFVWCSDRDHNGDRVYVGKYNDVDGVNRDGFSIHRHLKLRPCYACVD